IVSCNNILKLRTVVMKRSLIYILLLLMPLRIAMAIDIQEHIQELNEYGVTVLPQLYTEAEIQSFKVGLESIVAKVNETMKTAGKPRIFHNDGQKTVSHYWPIGNTYILQAGPGRFDTTYGFDKGVMANKKLQHHPIV